MTIDMMSSTPQQVADHLMSTNHMSVRSAESVAWRMWERAAGGTYFNRPNADSHEALFVMAVIRTLLNGPGGRLAEAIPE